MNYDYCNGNVYVVKAGDTLYSISRRYNIPLALVLRANPYVDVYNLQIGDEICIPMEMEPTMPGEGPYPFPTPSLPGNNGPAMPGEGPYPFPTPSLPGNNGPAMPGEGPYPYPTPSLPGNNGPAMPGEGPYPYPTPSLPGNNGPAMPGEGPYPFPTPSLPGNNGSSMPGEGPYPFPTPSLPGNNGSSMPGGSCSFPTSSIPGMSCSHYHVVAYVIKDFDTLQKILDYFNIALEDLLQFNQLNSIALKPGMTIRIPKRVED